MRTRPVVVTLLVSIVALTGTDALAGTRSTVGQTAGTRVQQVGSTAAKAATAPNFTGTWTGDYAGVIYGHSGCNYSYPIHGGLTLDLSQTGSSLIAKFTAVNGGVHWDGACQVTGYSDASWSVNANVASTTVSGNGVSLTMQTNLTSLTGSYLGPGGKLTFTAQRHVVASKVEACMNGSFTQATSGLSPIGTAVACASAATGLKYCLGGKGVATGPPHNCPALSFDCAGLISMAYKAAGITVGATAQGQYNAAKLLINGQPMTDRSQLQVGDLVFFDYNDYQRHGTTSTDRIDHVGMIVSTSPTITWISAPGTGQTIAPKPFPSGPITTATWVGTARP